MSPLTIIATIRAKPGLAALVQAELLKLIPPTRAEEGCIAYDLHQDNDDPERFTFVEAWESRDLWQTHMNAPHLAAYMEATDGAVAEFTLRELTRIG